MAAIVLADAARLAIEAAVVGIVDRVDITETTSDEMRQAARELARDNGNR